MLTGGTGGQDPLPPGPPIKWWGRGNKGDGFITRFSFSTSFISSTVSVLSSVSMRLSMLNPPFLRGLLGVGVVDVHVVGVVDCGDGILFLNENTSIGGIMFGGGNIGLL